jgi:hypothetical protein
MGYTIGSHLDPRIQDRPFRSTSDGYGPNAFAYESSYKPMTITPLTNLNSMASYGDGSSNAGFNAQLQGLTAEDMVGWGGINPYAGSELYKGSKGLMGDLGKWWSDTPWTGSGGKFSGIAKGVGTVADIFSTLQGIKTARSAQKLQGLQGDQIRQAMAGQRAQAQLGLQDRYDRRLINKGIRDPEAFAKNKARALEDMKNYGLA